ncbi:unnamed protein product [Durusdinium trenchii]|uniref:Palmitoyltransferase n=1 Tax=Durusdinium trenchii TaxID=1381693 RepID=A0ABP0S8U0_9DINO
MRIIGPCLVILAFCLQGFVTYAFFWHGLEPISLEAGWPASIALSILGVFLLANALYNYTKAILTPGGIPPPYEKEQPELMNITEKQIPARQCTKCGLLKPPRAHHCSVCGVCIMKMDHHCPWINNCVGIGNYRFFFLFLLFLGLACLFIIAVFGFFFYDIIFAFGRRGTRAFRNCVLMSFMICVSIFVALCMLGGFHFYLILTNQTTIEFQLNMVRRRQCRKNGEPLVLRSIARDSLGDFMHPKKRSHCGDMSRPGAFASPKTKTVPISYIYIICGSSYGLVNSRSILDFNLGPFVRAVPLLVSACTSAL